MAELARLLEGLGLTDVRTYIQSGNSLFRSPRRAATALAQDIAAAIESVRGFRPQVLVLSAKEFHSAIDNNPFPVAESAPTTLHFFFLFSKPVSPNIETLEKARAAKEQFQLKDRVFYLHAPDGIGRSKLASSAQRLLGVDATARNWRTVTKLAEMLGELKE